MTTDLNITIRRIEQATCDLSDKQTECAVCTLPGEMEVIVSTSKLLEFIRFHQKTQDRKNGNGSATKRSMTGTAVSTSLEQ